MSLREGSDELAHHSQTSANGGVWGSDVQFHQVECPVTIIFHKNANSELFTDVCEQWGAGKGLMN